MSTSTPQFPPVRACLFDMDGLLLGNYKDSSRGGNKKDAKLYLDTEDVYTKVTNTILHKYGKPDLPWSIKAQLQGRPRLEANAIFHSWANLPITPEEYSSQQVALQREGFRHSKPLPGTEALLERLCAAGMDIALATSSHRDHFHYKTDHLQEFMSAFPLDRRVLGNDSRIPPGRGKPAPDIYFVALETINSSRRAKGEREIQVEECLVFEDSVPGIEAGRRAGMRVIWCPHPGLLKEFEGREPEVLAGLIDGGGSLDSADGQPRPSAEKAEAGWPGKRGDGWAEQLRSLEDFDFERYGIKVP